MPAWTYDHLAGLEVVPGWMSLLLGPAGVVNWHFEWFANVALCVAWIRFLSGRQEAALMYSITALALAGSFLLRDGIWVWEGPERGYHALLGYYLWVGSISLAFIASLAA